MSVYAVIGGREYQLEDYEVSEDATPLSGSDSTGSVGTITLNIPAADLDISGDTDFALFHAEELLNQDLELRDLRRGYTLGTVTGVSYDHGNHLYSVDCRTTMGELIAYNIQSQPFSGSFENAVAHYLSLAGVTGGFLVDSSIANRQVLAPGWFGDLWQHLKMFAVSQAVDITFVSGVILFRPIRQRVAINGRDDAKAFSRPSTNKAQFVEVFQYNNRTITDGVVYPVPGEENTEVFTVERGKSASFQVELSASLSSINNPDTDTLGSTYRILTDEGEEVPKNVWLSSGGSVNVEINPDTTSLTVTVIAPEAIPTASAYRATSFSLARSNWDNPPVPTLRLTGSGVAFSKQSVLIATGVPPEETGTEVGTSIDNPFLSSASEVYTAGVRAAKEFAGPSASLSGTVTAINRQDDSGFVSLVSYRDVQGMFEGSTYGDLQETWEAYTYQDVHNLLQDSFGDDDITQVFGNVQGSRIFDKRSRRWYRIRSARITPDGIRYDADDDLTWADMQGGPLDGLTYAEVQARYNGMTYSKVERIGMYFG